MLAMETIQSPEREAIHQEANEWVQFLQGVIERNRPGFEREQAQLLADGIIDDRGNLLIKDLPKDMRPGSGSDVGG